MAERLDKITELSERIAQLHKNVVSYESFISQRRYSYEWIQEEGQLTIQLVQLLYGGQNE